MNKKIIKNAHIITMNPQMDIITNGNILIENGIIKKITTEDLSGNDAEVTDADGMFLLPGFINTHTHLPMTMLRGYADDLSLHKWLTEYIFPAEAKLVNEKNVRIATRLAFVEMIKSGTTCFNDMYFFEDAIAEEASKAGIRGRVAESLIDFPTPSFKDLKEGTKLTEALIEKWQGNALIYPGVCAHAPYTCSASTLRFAKGLADRYHTQLHLHLAETKKEVEDLQKQTGMTPAAYLDSLGILDHHVIAAHCVWLSQKDIQLMQQRHTSIAHCPKSNLKLSSGIAHTDIYIKAGIPVGIGTDGTASNNNLDMVEEMRFAALLAKVAENNPEAINARTALQMSTINGAKAIGLDHITGSIEVGKAADLILVNAEASNMQPIYDEYSAIVYSMNCKNIRFSMINGKWVMKNRQLTTLDKDSIMSDIKELKNNIIA